MTRAVLHEHIRYVPHENSDDRQSSNAIEHWDVFSFHHFPLGPFGPRLIRFYLWSFRQTWLRHLSHNDCKYLKLVSKI